jgi:MoaA/NifB/PqqE/SkfB family radical SAM enzyme
VPRGAGDVVNSPTRPLDFLWLEITGRCQLACEHCYASSGPRGTHGTTATADWKRIIDETVDLGVARSVRPGQQVDAAVAELRALGVADIGVDRVRQVGRGVRDAAPDIAQLCGGCAGLSLAVSPVGDAWPCAFSRWLRVGNVREEPLEAVNARAGEVRRELAAAFAERRGGRRCGPDGDGGLCRPVCMPVLGCRPFRAER